jgi:hypothetical protein
MKSIIIGYLVLHASLCMAQEKPSKRNSAAILYHPGLKEMLIYGGSTHTRSSTPMRDSCIWQWNGTRWKKYTTAPSLRSDVVFTYDPFQETIILYGGSFNYSREKKARYNDTWEYQTGKWTQTSASSLPSNLFHTAGAFSQVEKSLILFGGYSPKNEKLLDETWSYKNSNWEFKPLTLQPSARNLFSMFYDNVIQGVVLVGGDNMSQEGIRDMWVFKNNSWSKLSNDLPFKFTSRYAAVALGKTGNYLIFVSSSHDNISETWLWKGESKTWEKLIIKNPSPRNAASLGFDEARQCAVLFGGEIGIESTDEVWEFSLKEKTWSKVFPK